MKRNYTIRITNHEGKPVTAYVRASRLTRAVRLVLESTKARTFRSIESITREA